MDTADWYARFAALEASGSSPRYAEWSREISADGPILEMIDRDLPPDKRQPNLLLAATKLLGVRGGPYPHFREWLVRNWPDVTSIIIGHSTQTNEVGRTAVLLPALATLPGPLALIEVGAAAGLCLFPDRFSYYYSGHGPIHPIDGPSRVEVRCETTGEVPLPDVLPEVVFRAGVDLNPLRVTDSDDVRWLEALVWPEHHERLARLREAVKIAQHSPPALFTGDLNSVIEELVYSVPADATAVVFHSAVLNYLDPESRYRFQETVKRLPCHWLSNESQRYITWPGMRLPAQKRPNTAQFTLALDGIPLAYSSPHGGTLDWFQTSS